jgi:hypothetical protein
MSRSTFEEDLQAAQESLFLFFSHSPNNDRSIFEQKHIRHPFLIMIIVIRLISILWLIARPSSGCLAEASLSSRYWIR